MTYRSLKNGLFKANKPGPCLTLLEAACLEQANITLTENMKLCITVVTAVGTVGEYERALELVSQITQQFHDL